MSIWKCRSRGQGSLGLFKAIPLARFAGRKLSRRSGVRLFRLRGRDSGGRPLRPGLCRAGGRARGDRDRSCRELPRAKPETRVPAPGRARRTGVRGPRILPRRFSGRVLRRCAPAGKLRDPAGRGHELRPQDAPQLLLELLDQPRDHLSGRGLRVGLPLRRPACALGGLPRRLLGGVKPAPDGRAGQPAAPGRGHHSRRSARARHGHIRLPATTEPRPQRPGADFAAELRRIQGRDGKPGAASGSAQRRPIRRDGQRRPSFPRTAWRRPRDVRAHGSSRVLARIGVRHLSKRRVDRFQPQLRHVSALHPAAAAPAGAPEQPRHFRPVVSDLPNVTPNELKQDPYVFNPPDENAAYIDHSALSQQAHDLAVRVTRDHSSNQYDLVMALTSYLQQNYEYTQQLGHVPPGRDPVDWFLFDVKKGYCEQFATAETLMLRSLGVPARLATGYSTGDYNPDLDQSIVREHDAHAWVEVWFPNHGWVPIDPSPGFSALAATQFPNHWAASGLARLIPHLTIGAPMAVIGSLGALAVIPPAVVIALLVTVLWAWLRTRRRRAPGRRASPGESELLRLYERVQRRLGRRRAPPETPLEYLRVAPTDGVLLEELTEAVNEGAYAGRWPEPSRVRELERLLR